MDLINFADREAFLDNMTSSENLNRKSESLMAFEVYNDRLAKYVKEYLQSQYSEKTVLEMPVISSVNLCKRIANKEASLYKEAPEREFTGSLTDDQKDELAKLYDESDINSKLFKSNVYYKVQGQNFLKVLVKQSDEGGGKLFIKSLLPHHLDVIPNSEDPEIADAYIQSSFDKKSYLMSDGTNQKIADPNDYESTLNKYYVWDAEKNFMFNGKGQIESEVLPNPIGTLPFIDVAPDKDFEFFVRCGQALVDFSIQYCAALSDLGFVIKMQGFAVGVLKAPSDMTGLKSLTIGPNKILHLPIDPNNPLAVSFEYVAPQADVAGSIQYVENLLSNFLTSRGLDPSLVNGKSVATKYNSGVDRLLGMIEQFESSKQDVEVYKNVEQKLFDLIKRWSQVTFGTDMQFLSFSIPDDAGIDVEFHEPSIVQSKKEKLDYLVAKIDAGLTTKQAALESLDDIDKEQAVKMLEEIRAERLGTIMPVDTGTVAE